MLRPVPPEHWSWSAPKQKRGHARQKKCEMAGKGGDAESGKRPSQPKKDSFDKGDVNPVLIELACAKVPQ